MHTSRFEPWNLINLLHRDLDQPALRRFGRLADNGNSVADWIPAVDIVEHRDRFVLRADLPGVSVDAIDVRMEDGTLSLTGERKRDSDEEIDGVRRIERASGKFFRRFSLPDTADAKNISARSSNGILEVTIPKQPDVQARRITVEAA